MRQQYKTYVSNDMCMGGVTALTGGNGADTCGDWGMDMLMCEH
jgi:hypothetical protein